MVDDCLPQSHLSLRTVTRLEGTTKPPTGFTTQTTQRLNFRSPPCIFPGVAGQHVMQSAATQEEFQDDRIHLSSQAFSEVAYPELYNPYYHTLPGRSANLLQTGVLSEQSCASTQHSGLRRQENLAAKGSETDCTPSSSISGPTEYVLSGRRRKQRVICGWDDCHKTMTRGSLRRHHTEVHEGRKRKKTRTGEGAPHDTGPE